MEISTQTLELIQKNFAGELLPVTPSVLEELEEQKLDSYMPVSYTHLDVYKRQPLYYAYRRGMHL